ncbi:hypothetical protein E4U30_004781 [Claviceps sp. LM220 group G6]|nr:hypothetical protein E4U30_004781 [Claviceps sp. LM220 group G6]
MASSQDEFLSPEGTAQTTQHAIASELPLSIRRFEQEISSGWKRDYIDPGLASPQDATDWMANRIREYTNKTTLTLENFKEDFGNWPLKLFTEANTGVRSCLRDLLQKKGLETKKGTGGSVPKILYEIAKSEKAEPIVPIAPIRPPTPTNPATEAEPTQTIQLMILQTIQQIQQQSQQAMQQMQQMQQTQEESQQQSRQQSKQQTRMMQQMIEQITKLTVKQSTPRAPTATRSTQDSDKNPTGTYKLTYVNTESDKPDTSMPDASPFVSQGTHRSVTEEDPDTTMHTNTAAERRQHISKQQHDCRKQISVAPEDCQRLLLLQSPPAQIQTDFDSQQARLAPGMYLQRSQVPQLSQNRHQHEQSRLSLRTEAPMDCKQPLSTSIESQIPWTYQTETLYVPREQSTSALPIESKIPPPYLKQALSVPSTTPHSRHVHKQPPPCDRLQKQLQPVPQKQHLTTQPPQQRFLPTRRFDQACPPHAQRPAAFPLNAKTSDDAGNEDTNGIPDRSSDRSSDDSGDECYTDALDGDESLIIPAP